MAKKKAQKSGKSGGSVPAALPLVDIKDLAMPPKLIPEEVIRTVLAVILFLLFLLLFGGAAWYFLTQVDTTLVSGTGGTPSSSSSIAMAVSSFAAWF